MSKNRCPECGIRLTTNYCHICMKRVPFSGLAPESFPKRRTESSSAHKAEKDHTCVSFDMPEKKPQTLRREVNKNKKMPGTKAGTKKAGVAAIVLAVMSVVSSLIGLADEVVTPPEPEINYDAYVTGSLEDGTAVPCIAPTELYNDGEITITADSAGLYYDEYALALTIQNESDRDITVCTELFSVNGYMMSGDLYAEVKAGETEQSFLTIYSFDLETAGIEQIACIEFHLNIYDPVDYSDLITTDLIVLETDRMDTYVQQADTSGWELYNDGSVSIRLRSAEVSSYGECYLNVHIENLSGSVASVSAQTIRLNGQEVSGYFWNTLRSNTRAITDVYLYDLEEQNISDLTQMEEISMDLHIEYMEDWYVAETINETVTFNPNEVLG